MMKAFNCHEVGTAIVTAEQQSSACFGSGFSGKSIHFQVFI